MNSARRGQVIDKLVTYVIFRGEKELIHMENGLVCFAAICAFQRCVVAADHTLDVLISVLGLAQQRQLLQPFSLGRRLVTFLVRILLSYR